MNTLSMLQLLLMTALVPAALSKQTQLTPNETEHSAVSNAQSQEFFIDFTQPANQSTAFRLETRTSSANKSLLMVARQQDTVDTWWLPYSFVETNGVGDEVGRTRFRSVGRTLCPAPVSSQEQRIRVHLTASTHSKEAIGFNVTAHTVPDFHLRLGSPVSDRLLPSSPRVYYFQFEDDSPQDEKPLEAVRVEVESADDACGLVSVQRSNCPMQKLPPAVLHTGYRQTFLSNAVILMRRDEYRSFFVVLTAFPSNQRCLSKWKQEESSVFEGKNFTMRVERVRMHHNVGEAVAEFTFGSFIEYVVLGLLVYIFIYYHKYSNCFKNQTSSNQQLDPRNIEANSGAQCDQSDHHSLQSLRQEHRVKLQGSYLFTCQFIAIIIFYGLPAIQLLLQNQSDVSSGGDMDKCYYNFKCRFYVRFAGRNFYTFNSFISNVKYCAAGFAFIIFVMVKQCMGGICSPKRHSIPRCYSAYYGAGLALVMEGVLSAFYHVCPTHDNFQFDTAFMFMLCGMLGLALYCKRNPNTNMLTGMAFVTGSVAVLLNSVGILLSKISVVWQAHMQISLGVLVLIGAIVSLFSNVESKLKVLFCAFQGIFSIVCFGLGISRTDISIFYLVLSFIGSHTLIYFIFYLVNKRMKCRRYNAKIGLRCAVFIASVVLLLSALLFMGNALMYFFNPPTDSDASPAESRAKNTECLTRFLGVPFDKHDMWHILGSHGIFCALLLVLFIDADEEDIRKENLPVY